MNSNTVKQYVEEFRKKLALDLPENAFPMVFELCFITA